MLARGDQRDFVAIDPAGGVHSVARRIEGAKAADVRRRFADLDPKLLPSVAEAKKLQHERQGEHGAATRGRGGDRAIERSQPRKPIRRARRRGRSSARPASGAQQARPSRSRTACSRP